MIGYQADRPSARVVGRMGPEISHIDRGPFARGNLLVPGEVLRGSVDFEGEHVPALRRFSVQRDSNDPVQPFARVWLVLRKFGEILNSARKIPNNTNIGRPDEGAAADKSARSINKEGDVLERAAFETVAAEHKLTVRECFSDVIGHNSSLSLPCDNVTMADGLALSRREPGSAPVLPVSPDTWGRLT